MAFVQLFPAKPFSKMNRYYRAKYVTTFVIRCFRLSREEIKWDSFFQSICYYSWKLLYLVMIREKCRKHREWHYFRYLILNSKSMHSINPFEELNKNLSKRLSYFLTKIFAIRFLLVFLKLTNLIPTHTLLLQLILSMIIRKRNRTIILEPVSITECSNGGSKSSGENEATISLGSALSKRRQSKVPGPSEAGKYDNSNKISARKSYRANYQPHNKIILKTWIATSPPPFPRGDDGLARLESTYYATKGNFIQRWKGGGGSWLSCRLGTMVDIQRRYYSPAKRLDYNHARVLARKFRGHR